MIAVYNQDGKFYRAQLIKERPAGRYQLWLLRDS